MNRWLYQLAALDVMKGKVAERLLMHDVADTALRMLVEQGVIVERDGKYYAVEGKGK